MSPKIAKSRALVLAAALAAPLLAARAADVARLPVRPFTDAREGDWSSYVVSVGSESRTLSTQVVTFRIVSIKENAVVSRADTRTYEGHEALGAPATFARDEAPSLEAYFRMPIGTTTIGDVEVADEPRAALGRTFACKRVSFSAVARGRRASAVVWLSTEVRASSIVAAKVLMEGGSLEYELAGFGTKDAVALGRKPEDVGTEPPR